MAEIDGAELAALLSELDISYERWADDDLHKQIPDDAKYPFAIFRSVNGVLAPLLHNLFDFESKGEATAAEFESGYNSVVLAQGEEHGPESAANCAACLSLTGVK
jgi:hypothetical protein